MTGEHNSFEDLVCTAFLDERINAELARIEVDAPDEARIGQILEKTVGRSSSWRSSSLTDGRVRLAVCKFLRETRDAARTHAEHQLYDLSARGVEWFRATAGSVFVFDAKKKELRSLESAEFNTYGVRRRIPLNGDGIVAHVARTSEGFYTNDVSSVPFYREEIADTRSELVVPLFDGPNRDRLIGVYNLESRDKGAFTTAQVEELQEKVAYLVPHILVLDHLDRTDDLTCGWHPEIHGWNPARYLREFCRVVGTSLVVNHEPPPSCSVWHVDWTKKEVWALAAHGYDYKFLNDDWLPIDSATAKVAKHAERTLCAGTPSELCFVRRKKSERMKLDHVTLASLHNRRKGLKKGIGTLRLDFFANRPPGQVPSDDAVSWLAEQAEGIIEDVNNVRLRLAPAYLAHKFASESFSSRSFRPLLKTTLDELGAEAGSVFVRGPNSTKLQCAFTTGLEGVSDITDAEYDLEEDAESSTCKLARNGGTARINRAHDRQSEEHGNPSSRHWRETLDGDAGLFRRFLGAGVSIGDRDNPDMLGVIRVNRSLSSRPFTEADEKLVEIIADHSKWLFANWGFEQIGKDGFVEGASKRVQVEKVLEHMVYPAQRKPCDPPTQATLFVRHEDTEPRYRTYVYRSRIHKVAPEYLDDHSLYDQVGKDASLAIERMSVVEVRRLHSCHDMAARLCAPLLSWSGPHLVDAVLAMDFKGGLPDWNEDARRALFDQFVRLSAMWGIGDRRLNRLFLRSDSSQAFDRWCSYVVEQDEMVSWIRCDLRNDGQPFRQLDFGTAREAASKYVSPPSRQLVRYGVEVTEDGSRCKLPLYVGPCVAGTMELGITPARAAQIKKALAEFDHDVNDLSDVAFEPVRSLVASITSVWCKLMVNGDLWDIDLATAEDVDGELQDWKVKVRWNANNWSVKSPKMSTH